MVFKYISSMIRVLWLVCMGCITSQVCAQPYKLQISDLLYKTRLASYYDSITVFTRGEKCIEFARAYNDKAAEAEVNIYYGNFHFYMRKLDKASEYFKKALKISTKAKDQHIQTLAKIRLTYTRQETGFTGAENHFRILLREAKNNRDASNQIECLNALSLIFRARNLDKEATDVLLQALPIAETCNDKVYLGTVLNNLGLIKFDNGQSSEAQKDFERGLRVAESIGDFRLAIHLSTNLSIIYLEQDSVQKALNIERKMVDYARRTGFRYESAAAFINLASTLESIDSLKQAMRLFDSAIVVMTGADTMAEVTKAILGRALIMRKLKNDDEALKLIILSEKIAKRKLNAEDLMHAYRLRSEILRDGKNFGEAIQYIQLYHDLEDSIRKLRNSEAIAELTVKYESEKKELALQKARQKTKLLEQDNHLRTIRMRSVISVIILLAIALAIVFYIRWIRTTRKQQEKFSQQLLENIDKERGRIARDLHDDLGQSLSAIKSRVSMGVTKDQNREIDEELGRVIEQTREISRSLYPSYLEKVGLKLSMARLAETTQVASGLQCSCETDDKVEELNTEQKTHLFRILQECVNNTVKHAGATALKMTLVHDGTRFILQYLDNGRSVTSEDSVKTGMGLMSIRERARILGGEAIVHTSEGKGFKLIVTFKQ